MLTLSFTVLLLTGATEPLPLPESFDPAVNLPMHKTELGTFHQSRAGAGLAADLVANGTPDDLARAEKVLEAQRV